ncbi:MAG TPA: DNA methyltransferase [Thermoplasmata archaeon]|nr:DNA methyltransferase [Thermoplasmata archaeon]
MHRSVPVALRRALVETGPIGSTTRQLSSRLSQPEPELSALLERLADHGQVVRIGRGLWLLADYAELDLRRDFRDPKEYIERFSREHGVTLGEQPGPITFSDNADRPVHRWWPYVQGYSAEFVADVIGREGLAPGSTVLDPFTGSGTTLVEARRAGHRALGYELMPPAALAARVKIRFEMDPERLTELGDRILRNARSRRPGPRPFLRETSRQFLPRTLARLTRLRDALPVGENPLTEAGRLAFGRTLVPVSRLHRSPCLGYGRADADVFRDPWSEFKRAVAEMADDLHALQATRSEWGPPGQVWQRDARTLDLPPRSVDLALTSPPYVNGMDYVNNYKLDLAWLGYAGSYTDLRRLRESMVACDNLGREAVRPHLQMGDVGDPWLREILGQIRSNVERKQSYRRDDAHGVVKRYFSDLRPVLAAVFRLLRPGGRFRLVVGDSLLAGTYVPGDLLTARLGAEVGFRIESVDVARRRWSGQRRNFPLRETIVTLVRPTSVR